MANSKTQVPQAQRQQNFQNIAWFIDLHNRDLLDLNPPYQRRSVWSNRYREDFVDTILLNYPAPAIFLFEMIAPEGPAKYAVVDGKQRLMTIFSFVNNEFPIGENSEITKLQGTYYDQLPKDLKVSFLRYRFSVEMLPSDNETEINNIFDRLNRNVKKLSAQELRHARYDGDFINAAENLAETMVAELPSNFPRITGSSLRQMKDVEVVATLLLLLEEGPKSYSTADFDEAFAQREDWDAEVKIKREFRQVLGFIKEILASPGGDEIAESRLRNQADFYSLFGAIAELRKVKKIPKAANAAKRLRAFCSVVDGKWDGNTPAEFIQYFEDARSASNDVGPRKRRIEVLRKVLLTKSTSK